MQEVALCCDSLGVPKVNSDPLSRIEGVADALNSL